MSHREDGGCICMLLWSPKRSFFQTPPAPSPLFFHSVSPWCEADGPHAPPKISKQSEAARKSFGVWKRRRKTTGPHSAKIGPGLTPRRKIGKNRENGEQE